VVIWHPARRPFPGVGGEPTLGRAVYLWHAYVVKIPLCSKVCTLVHPDGRLSITSTKIPLRESSSELPDIVFHCKRPIGFARLYLSGQYASSMDSNLHGVGAQDV
jgi:hypothetical protein